MHCVDGFQSGAIFEQSGSHMHRAHMLRGPRSNGTGSQVTVPESARRAGLVSGVGVSSIDDDNDQCVMRIRSMLDHVLANNFKSVATARFH